MKFCPKCQTKYDEEIIKFCTKDGAPLVEENPSFTAMPSQSSIDDIGEETLISVKRPNMPNVPPPPPIDEPSEPAKKVVIPISEQKKQNIKPIDNRSYQPPPPNKSNTGMVVLLTIFGTLTVLGGILGLWWFLGETGEKPTNNTNANVNNSNIGVNYNSNPLDYGNSSFDSNINTNVNSNSLFNTNTNTNTNLKPSPTKTPTPKPSPTANANVDINANTGNTVVNNSPSNTNTSTNKVPDTPATPKPTVSPKPSATPATPTPSNVNVGIINSRATSLPKPAYPQTAKQMGVSGQVSVQVQVDESGNVMSAKAVSGHPLLRGSAEAAARQSRFNPIKIGDKPVRANGTIVYNFINN